MKLNELNKVIGQPKGKEDATARLTFEDPHRSTSNLNSVGDNDPELEKLSSMMDKIIDIQHPERVSEQISQAGTAAHKEAFIISDRSADDTIVDGFYSLDEPSDTASSNAVAAVVHDNEVLKNGSVIRLRLTSDAYINNIRIPKGNFVYGTVTPEGERLNVAIRSIRVNNSVYPVQLEVYDMDGLKGIYIPGALSRDVLKQSADNSLQLMQISSLDPTLKAQATAAGIGTLKNLLSKKVKQVKVFIKEGYKVLLQNRQS